MKERLDKDRAKRNIQEILEKLHDGSDVSMLHEYHKLYKKEISLFRRSWAAAWLFMYYDKRETPILQASDRTPKFQKQKEKQTKEIEVTLSDEESKQLFISIGKNRRLFPREVISLIMTKTDTPREDIGLIRILDNYSFVQVRDTKANEIIEALNGVKFRGRTLAVNFAKPKNAEDAQ